MRKVKPIRRLYFQFGRLASGLDAFDIAERLQREGLIEIVAYGEDGRPTHYREAALKRMPYKAYTLLVLQVLAKAEAAL
jgi:hypothetical protein